MTVRATLLAALVAACVPWVAPHAAPPGGSEERIAIKAGKLLDVRTGKYQLAGVYRR